MPLHRVVAPKRWGYVVGLRTGGSVGHIKEWSSLVATSVIRCLADTTGSHRREDSMGASRILKTTMRVGVMLGVIAVLLIALSPLILGNFGTTTVVADAPVAMAVSTVYLLVTATFLPFSAALISASLVMRHAESLREVKRNV
jgi:Na+-driven multidrug efflux pump